MEDVEQPPAGPLRMLVGLVEQSRHGGGAVERVGEPVEGELLDDHRTLADPGAAEADVDLLRAHLGRPLGAPLELPQPALGRLQLGAKPSDIFARRRISATISSSRWRSSSYELRSRVIPQPRLMGLVVAGEAAAVGPRAVGLDGDVAGRRRGEQLAVVADEQDRLA
jgi:hypothetical protein